MEKDILSVVTRRNRILDELIQINHLAIDEFKNLSEDDWSHFLLTRKYLIESLTALEDEIILLSMYDWSSFSFDPLYKSDYVSLTDKKDYKLSVIIEQDKNLARLQNRPNEKYNVA